MTRRAPPLNKHKFWRTFLCWDKYRPHASVMRRVCACWRALRDGTHAGVLTRAGRLRRLSLHRQAPARAPLPAAASLRRQPLLPSPQRSRHPRPSRPPHPFHHPSPLRPRGEGVPHGHHLEQKKHPPWFSVISHESQHGNPLFAIQKTINRLFMALRDSRLCLFGCVPPICGPIMETRLKIV